MGRFGPRSLAARLLTVLLVPMIGLQVFAYRELDAQREAEDSAARVSEQVSLLQHTGQLIVPLYIEFTATAGVAEAEVRGLDRIELDDTLGIDFVGFVSESRAQLDEALAALSASSGAVRLPSGVTIGEEIASIESELADVRAEFDAQAQRPDSVNVVFDRLVSFVDDISEQTRQVLQEAATTSELAGIGAESEQFLSTLQSATTNLRLVADASIAGGERSLVLEAMVATGAFEESLDRLRSLLDGHRLTEFDELVASPAFAAVDEALPTLVEALTLVDDSGINVIDDTEHAHCDHRRAHRLVRPVDRAPVVRQLVPRGAGATGGRRSAAEADADRHDAIRVMVAVLGVSLVLLGLILLSILRPLRRLVRQSRQVGEGDLSLAPVKPTGPTDIRVVMRTFNDMVTTLRAYDAQVRRLALGDTEIDRSLPGPLGDTLRQSVSHLAAVTSKLHASEAAANEQARTDSLTGLANRAAALERLARIAIGRSDTTSAAAPSSSSTSTASRASTTRRATARATASSARSARVCRPACPDQLVARIGGDEFIVLVETRSPTGTGHRARPPAHRASCRHRAPAAAVSCSPSRRRAGVSIVDGSREPTRLHRPGRLRGVPRQGDAAADASRCTTSASPASIEDRADMALTMRQGLASDQFSLKLQPIIDIATKEPGRRRGAAALEPAGHRRGRAPTSSSPSPNAPASSSISMPGCSNRRWASCATGRTNRSPPRLRIAVNISGRHIVEGTLSSAAAAPVRRAERRPGDDRSRDHRDPPRGRRRPRRGRGRRSAAAGHQGGHRRLRHGVLVDELPAPAHRRHAQDRRRVRGRHVREPARPHHRGTAAAVR